MLRVDSPGGGFRRVGLEQLLGIDWHRYSVEILRRDYARADVADSLSCLNLLAVLKLAKRRRVVMCLNLDHG